MTTLREAAQQALDALEWNYNTDLDNIPACEQWAKMLKENITALRAVLAEPQTTHWEGCEEVHPECKNLADYEFKTYKIGGFHLEEGFYSATELREMVKELDAMDAAAKRSMEEL